MTEQSFFSINEINKIINGKILFKKTENISIKDILIDSRKLISSENCLFFAIHGKRNDGHNYLDRLYYKGIRNFIVSNQEIDYSIFDDANVILVDNTLIALQNLCAAHRQKFDIPVIGITGSNGKTIVKEWLFQLMSTDWKIIRSPKSYNSQVGVPLSVWQMNSKNDLAIFEAGISEQDEMDNLQKIIKPTIGIFTNIGQAHNMNFIETTQKVGEKLKLFTKVETLIYCPDYSEIQEVIIKSEILRTVNPFTWSRKTDANLKIKPITKTDRNFTVIEGVYKESKIGIKIPFTDDASIENAIHCWATMLFLNYKNDVIAQRMLKLSPIAMRLELKEGIYNCSIINDSYNSDVNSLKIALDFLNQQNQHRKKTIILSDILQSGRNEIDLYSEIAELLEKKGIERLIGVGPSISRQADKFKIEKYFFESTDDFLKRFSFSTFNNECILLKGARIFEFEQISKALQQKTHDTILEINLNALVHNLNYYRSKLKPSTKIMAMVKAFSYGSGSYEIANVLQFHHIDYLAVAYVDEGVELRKAGITTPIMVMSPEEESFDAIIKHSLEPEIYSFRILNLLEKSITNNNIPKNKPIKIHIKLDTGMHRLGFERKEIDVLLKRLKVNPYIYVQSVFSHLAGSENPDHDNFTNEQIKRFVEMSNIIKENCDHSIFLHILNSAGISRFPDKQFDMVRLGIGLYGVGANESEQKQLENVSTLKSNITQIKNIKAKDTIGYDRGFLAEKDMKIGIIPIGYADGLNRNLGNGRGKLLVKGKFAPIIGNICMDMCMINITDIKVKEGDEVIVFGEDFSIKDLAKDLETIAYEVLTGISRRVKRVYFME